MLGLTVTSIKQQAIGSSGESNASIPETQRKRDTLRIVKSAVVPTWAQHASHIQLNESCYNIHVATEGKTSDSTKNGNLKVIRAAGESG